MSCLDKLRALGYYEIAIASGSVQTEEDALTAAQALAAPERIETDVQTIADKAAIDAAALAVARGGASPQAIAETVARITQLALETITVARNDTVAFHERALEIAKAMPTTYVVSGPGFTTLYFDVDDATGEPTEACAELVGSLLNPDLHAARLFHHRTDRLPNGEEIRGYVDRLREKGWTVTPEIEEGATNPKATISAEGHPEKLLDTVAKLRDAAETLPDLTVTP